MKASRFYLSLVSLLLVPAAFAAGPVEKRADNYYTKLWTNSPFTTKPPPVEITTRDPFEDYALSAVMPLPRGGYMVVIQNKKKPDDRVTILPDQPSDFKVEEVRKGDGKPRSMTVQLSQGSMKGVVSFDEKLLAIKQTAPKNPNGQPNGQGNPNNPNNPGANPAAGNPGAPNVVVNNPGNPGAPTAGPGNFHPGGGNGGNSNFNNSGGNGGGNNNSSGAAGVRPPRPRVIPSQGGGGGRR